MNDKTCSHTKVKVSNCNWQTVSDLYFNDPQTQWEVPCRIKESLETLGFY